MRVFTNCEAMFLNFMSIYNHSPLFMQNIMTSLQGMIYKKERYNSEYYHYYTELCNKDYSDYTALKSEQDKRLREFIRYAIEHSPFYREFYKDVDVDSIQCTEDLCKLPVLKKETVRENIDSFYTIIQEKAVVSNTSGTTGTSMKFLFTKEDMQKRMAYLDFFKHAHGFDNIKMKRASFNSAKIVPKRQKSKVFWRDNISTKQRIYSGYLCKGDNVRYYVENLNKYKPDSLDGYPSSMYELAKYIVNNGIVMQFVPKAIFPTAETLLPHYKSVIEKAFGCRVYDQYASSEGAPFITECECGKLHYCMDTGVIEFDTDGEMIVTCFETHGTPLIRYKIGDKAFISDEKMCSCGCVMPIVDRIEGRTMDYILSPKKEKFTSIYLSLVSGDFMNCMKAMQFIQNDIFSIDINIETDDTYRPEMDKIIIDKLHYSLGDEMEIRIHKVNEIPKDRSGKFKFIINNVPHNEVQ